MNWFERYGLIGSFALIFLLLPFLFNDYFSIQDLTSGGYIPFLVACVLPVGYLFFVISQIFYYLGWGGEQIHKSIKEGLSDEERARLELSCCDSEEIVETKLTTAFRLSKYSDRYVRLGDHGTKRWGVFSVNSAIRLAVICSLLIYFPAKWWKIQIKDFFMLHKDLASLFLIIVLLIVLYLSNKLLGSHIKTINTNMIKHYITHPQE
ncbi:MAG: hypothetical protein PHT59_05410 [Candidatus Omnitrophica bacterium]|nr:hypothetical protein [Candidatus Omnitrophota bacterium]